MERVPEKKERNLSLYKDWLNGMNQIEMVKKYNITTVRIYQILLYMRKKYPMGLPNIKKTSEFLDYEKLDQEGIGEGEI